MTCEEFCRRHGWTPEKYRKVAQRGRAKLRALLAAEESPGAPPDSAEDASPNRVAKRVWNRKSM